MYTRQRSRYPTNIKTPSGDTGLLLTSDQRLRLRNLGAALVVLSVVVSGCASGSETDSRRFQHQEAEREQILPGAQATQMAQFFASPTAPPPPTITPKAAIVELALAASLRGDGGPDRVISQVPAYTNQTVYAVAQIASIQPGQVVTAHWRNKDGTVLLSSQISPPPSASPQWISFPVQFGQILSPGIYSVAIYVENDLLESLVFSAA
jgi:hypothetical protein